MVGSRKFIPARLLATVLVTLALTGCGQVLVKGDLRYYMDPAVAKTPPAWPAAPDVPRYLSAGELLGELNFQPDPFEQLEKPRTVLGVLLGIYEEGPTLLSLQRPQGGMVDEKGRVYVTDVGRAAVFVFDEAEGEMHIWESAGRDRQFLSPIALVRGKAEEILVTDADLRMVVRLDKAGNYLGHFGEQVLKRPTGIARDPQRGVIYVSDTHDHNVKLFDDEGTFIGVIGMRGKEPGEFNYPTHLAFRNGELYVTDSINCRIQVFSQDGEVLTRRFGERGIFLGNMVRPKGVAVDDEGNIYVVESYYDHLLVYDREGQFLMGIGGVGDKPGHFYLPAGVWVDKRNRVFVSDMFNSRISVFQFLGGQGG
jgi:DNA-binding beta-propeller fold protein YncE